MRAVGLEKVVGDNDPSWGNEETLREAGAPGPREGEKDAAGGATG